VTTPSIVFLQIARLAKWVFHSPILRDDLVICCEKSKLEPKQIKHSVPTRWNSVAEMINSVIYLRPALDKLVEMECHNAVSKTRLRHLKLTKQEWDIMTRLPSLTVSDPHAPKMNSKSIYLHLQWWFKTHLCGGTYLATALLLGWDRISCRHLVFTFTTLFYTYYECLYFCLPNSFILRCQTRIFTWQAYCQ